MASLDQILIKHAPFNVMPAHNPIQYVLTTAATHEYNYDVNCFVTGLIASSYDVWCLQLIPSDLTVGDKFSINGVEFEFVDCITRRSGNQILLTADICDQANLIIEHINRSYYAKLDNYRALKLTEELSGCNTTYKTDCNTVPFCIYIYSTVFAPLTLTATPQVPGAVVVDNVCPFVDNFLSDYKTRLCIYVEREEHHSGTFTLAGDVSNYAELANQLILDATVDPEREFYFNIENFIKPFLNEDLPSINSTTPQFAVNSIKKYYVLYGDTYIKDNIVFNSTLEQGATLTALNASFAKYDSNYNSKILGGPGTCISYESQNDLLKAYFNHSTATPQKFLTNTRNKLLTPDRLEYLHFWLRNGTDLTSLTGFFDTVACDGTKKTIESNYDFSNLSGCETTRRQDEQLFIIPLHEVIKANPGLLDGVCEFCFYLKHSGCYIPANGGRIDIELAQGGTIESISSTCFTIDFGSFCGILPSGGNQFELAQNLYNTLTTCNSTAFLQLVQNTGMSFEINSNVVSIIFEAAPDCDIKTAVMTFTIFDDNSYVFGDPLNERGLYLDFSSVGCSCFLPCIPTLARFSNASDFVNYLDNLNLYFTTYFSNLGSSFVEERAADNSYATYTVFLDVFNVQTESGKDICTDPLEFCIFGTVKDTFVKDDSLINLQYTPAECCPDDCCGQPVLIDYLDEPVPLDGKEIIDLEFNLFGAGTADLANIAQNNGGACNRVIYDFATNNNACYNTYLTGHTTAASLAQGLMDFYNNCVDVSWVTFIASNNLVLTLISPTVVRWEMDSGAAQCCNEGGLYGVGIIGGINNVTNEAIAQCFTIPPLHFVSNVQCCPAESVLEEISEKMPYRYFDACINDTGFLFNNRFGLNEFIYFEGTPNVATEAEREGYERNIYLERKNNNMQPTDREFNLIASEGRQTYRLNSSNNDKFFISPLREFFHSLRVRILERRELDIECGDSPCDTQYINELTPVTITNKESDLNNITNNITELEIQFIRSNKYNFE